MHHPAAPAARGRRLAAFRAALPYTLPIFAGFWFLGLTYGIYMRAVRLQLLVPHGA